MIRRMSAVVMIVITVLALGSPALATVEHCPDGGDKTEGQFNTLVLSAGTVFCVKAGQESSGVLVADGVSPLIDYVTWLNNGGRTPDVSHYVVYQQATTTTLATTTTVGQETTTTVAETTTTQQETTTTVVEETTSTTVVETTLGIPIESSTTIVRTELPFTGGEHYLLLAVIASFLAVLGLTLLGLSKK